MFGEPTLRQSIPDFFCGRYPVRLYTTPEKDGSYNWHVGFPRGLIQPVRVLLATSCYWDQDAWHEDDDFLLYYTPIFTAAGESPVERLKEQLDFWIRHYNYCLRVMRAIKSNK